MSSATHIENMPLKKPRRKWSAPKEKLSSETTAKKDFVAKVPPPRQSFKPKQDALKSDDPFEGYTGYKDVYVEHPIQPRKPKVRQVHVPPAEKFDGNTTARNDFRGDYVPKRESYKQDTKSFASNAPFEGTTTSKKDFPNHPVNRQIARRPQEISKPEGKIDLNTVNKTNFKEHPAQRQVAKRPSSSKALKGEGVVEKDSNYIKDYPAWETKVPEKVKPKTSYEPPNGQMNKDTTTKVDYPHHKAEKTKSFKPKDSAPKSDEPFDAYTGYNDIYVEHPIQPKQGRKREEYNPPSEPMESLSTNKQDFSGATVPKRKSYKRDTEAFRSEDPLDATTTSNLDYREFSVERPQIKKQGENLKLEGDIDTDTINKQTYREFPIQKSVAKRPRSSDVLKGSGNFEGNTGYNDIYREHNIPPRQSMKKNEYVPPEGEFEGQTTTRLDYPGQTVPKRESFKPKGDAFRSDDPFDAYTGYNDIYVEHPIQPKQGRKREEYHPPSEPMESLSTNKQDFSGATVPKRKSYKRDTEAFRSEDPLDATTTSNLDYREFSVERPQIKKQGENLKLEGDMDTDTINKQTYREFPIQKSVVKRPRSSDVLKGSGNFEGNTGYNDIYREHNIPPRQSMKKNEYVPPEGEFEGHTTTRLDYPGQTVPKRESFKPKGDAFKSDDPLDANTGYKNTYVEHPIQPKQGRKREEYHPPSEPMESLSTNKQDFSGATVPKRKSYKRDTEAFRSEDPLDATTTSNLDYREFSVERPQIKKQGENLKLEGDMDTDTINKQTYREFPIQKSVVKRPRSSDVLKGSGNFEGNTGYNDIYREHNIPPRQSMKKNEYVPPEGEFEGQTTTRLDYPGQTVPKRESFKPKGDAFKSDEPLDANTGYKNTYVEHPLQPKQGRKREEYHPPTEAMESLSTNKQDFSGATAPKRKSYKRDTEAFKSEDPFDAATTSNLDYREFSVERPQIKKQGENLKLEGDMDTDTINKQTYREFPIQKSVVKRPRSSDVLKGSGNFEGNTGYNDIYREHNIPPRQSMKKNEYVPPEGEFEGQTTTRLDYPGQTVPKRESFKPKGDAFKSDEPLDVNTGYKNTYVEHPIQPKQGRKREEYHPPTEAMESLSTNKQDFSGATVPKRKSYKRDTEAFKSEDPFDAATTSNLDYREFSVERPKIKKQGENLKLEGDMDTDTINKQTYREFSIQKNVVKRPRSSDVLKGSGNFEGNTGYNDIYREHNIPPRQSMKKNEYVPPEGEFEGQTTTRLDYPGQTVPKRESFKPKGDAFKSDDPLDANTGYKNTYVEHPIQPKHGRKREEYHPPTEAMESLSTNKQDFSGATAPKRKSYKRDTEAFKSEDPFDATTTSNLDYREFSVERPQIKKQGENLKLEGDMDTDTINKQTYREFPIQKSVVKRPRSSDVLKGSGNFEGNTGYNDIYREHNIPPRQSMKKNEYVPPEGEFEGQTTTRSDYPGQTVPKRESYKPKGDAFKSDAPFDGLSEFSRTFVQHDMPSKRVREKEQYKAPLEPMDCKSTSQQDYTGKPTDKRASYKRDTEPFKSDAPLEDSTTFNHDFKQWVAQRPQLKRQMENLTLEGDMDLSTINQSTYRGEAGSKRTIRKHASSNALNGDGKFYGDTGYGNSYQEWQISPKTKIQKDVYVGPVEPFSGESTNKSDFQEKPFSKRNKVVPAESFPKSHDPFAPSSGYQDSFIQHENVAKIVRKKEGYVPPSVPLDTTTTNKQDFQSIPTQKRTGFRPSNEPFKSNEPFDATTTAKNDFKEWQTEQKPLVRQGTYVKSSEPMDLQTTASLSYRGETTRKRSGKRPRSSNTLKYDGQFHGESIYRNSFAEREIPPKVTYKKQEYVPSSEKFEGETTSRLDYKAQPFLKSKSFKQPESALKSDLPMVASSSYRDSFMPVSAPPRPKRVLQVYNPPAAPFEAVSTSKADFIGTKGEKRTSYRPSNAAFQSKAKFDATTTFSADFQGCWENKRPQRQLRASYQPNPAPFSGETTNRESYTGHQTERSRSYKPAIDSFLKSTDRFDGSSTYRGDFASSQGNWAGEQMVVGVA